MFINASPRWGLAACAAFALISLGTSIHYARVLFPLLQDGIRTEAVIVGFDVKMTGGFKNRPSGGTKPVLRFTNSSGETVVRTDRFQMILFRFEEGDRVTVVYDPSDPGNVTIDLGLWTWQQAAVLFLISLVFAGFGLLLRARAKPLGLIQ